jgi:transposase
MRWRDAAAVYGPSKTLYNRFIRWSKAGFFNRIFANARRHERGNWRGHRCHASESPPNSGQLV